MPRLFIRQSLDEGQQVELDAGQTHYLGNVLRLKEGAELGLFDGRSGEWLARIAETGKKRMTLAVDRQIRASETIPDVWLAFAPVKRARTDWLVEKATELGVARLIPVITHRTVTERVKIERLAAITIEAAEQCGRTVLPDVVAPLTLERLLQQREPDRTLYFADESGGYRASKSFRAGPAMILTGPEGGFTAEERRAVRASANATAISLGPRILRAETAALAALTVFMSQAGDWT